MTVKSVHRGLLITAVAGGLMLASQSLASAATQPTVIPAPASIVRAAPAVPAPVASLLGIVTGTVAGATPVAGAPTVALPL